MAGDDVDNHDNRGIRIARKTSSFPNFSRLQLDSATADAGAQSAITAYRPSTAKQVFSQFHVTSNDLEARPATAIASPLFSIPERQSSTRRTRPIAQPDKRQYRYAFDTPPTLVRTPWEYQRTRGSVTRRRSHLRSVSSLSSRVFEEMPREIYQGILDNLRAFHSSQASLNVVGLQQDLRSLCLVNKRWYRFAREHLWSELWLPSQEEPRRRSLFSREPKSPLQRLARAVRNTPGLALLVRHLRVTSTLASQIDAELMTDRERQKLWAAIASITAACPNIESFSGYVPLITDKTSTLLAQALALCPKLRAHAWDLRVCNLAENSIPGFGPRALVECHDQWKGLETLVVCSSPSQQLGPGVISAVFQRLPSLKHLMLQHLSRHDFHNGTLMALPPLLSLRLEHLEGITDQGVEQLAYTRLASSLRRLSLVALELCSLRTLHTLFDHLCRLTHFAFIQNTSPGFLPGVNNTAALNLASSTLRTLHWAPQLGGTATDALVRQIKFGYFPRLQSIKAPTDYEGLLQGLCRPIPSQRLTAADRTLLQWAENENIIPTSTGMMSTYSSKASSISSISDDEDRALRLAQLQAQLRIRSRRTKPSMSVVVEDFDGESFESPAPSSTSPSPTITQQSDFDAPSSTKSVTSPTSSSSTAHDPPQRRNSTVQYTHVIGSFLGDLNSGIEYRLDEDVPGSGRALGTLDDVASPPRWAVMGFGARERDVGFDVLF